jgi:hypothetical protein
MAGDTGGLTGVDTAMLELMVRDLLGEPAVVVAEEWSCLPLGGGAGKGLGLYRVTGSPRIRGVSHPWALILKVCAAANGADPGAWDYPARERLAYDSGLFAVLPGGLAPPLPGCRDAARRDELALARGGHRGAPRSVAARALRLGRPRTWPLQWRLPHWGAPAWPAVAESRISAWLG